MSILSSSERERIADENPRPPSTVREALRRVLESQPFRASKQCQDLLRYIVDRSLSGDEGSLRERVIGTEVFGRKPTYDTGEDPVVRVRAADVRKRLAQYYQSLAPGDPELRIELQRGSYLAHFSYEKTVPEKTVLDENASPEASRTEREPDVEPQAQAQLAMVESQESHSSLRKTVALVLLVVAMAGSALWVQSFRKTPQELFWAPLISTRQPVLLYLGSNAAYVFTPNFLDKYRAEHSLPNTGREFFVDLPPSATVNASDIAAAPDTFVTVGDLAASVQLATLITAWKRPFILRSGRDLSFGDLRNRPSVMIGGFNNPWTLELTRSLPFSFRQGTRIQDRDHPEKAWVPTLDNHTGSTDDFALITRLVVSDTGGPLLTIAGIGEFGTQAAAEFVANPEKMRDLLKSAPHDWQTRNMQAVLHIKVMGYTPVAVEVVVTTYW